MLPFVGPCACSPSSRHPLALAVAVVLFAAGPLAPEVTLASEREVPADAPLRFTTTGVVGEVSVEVDGRPVPVTRTATGWETRGERLQDGEATVSARAAGPGGVITAVQTWTISADGEPPELEVDATRHTDAADVEVNGSTEAGARIRVDGGERPARTAADQDGAFAVEVALRGGENRLEVVAADAAGNETTDAMRIVRDAQAPELEIETSDSVDSSTPAIAVTAQDTTKVTVHAELDGERVGEEREADDEAVDPAAGLVARRRARGDRGGP